MAAVAQLLGAVAAGGRRASGRLGASRGPGCSRSGSSWLPWAVRREGGGQLFVFCRPPLRGNGLVLLVRCGGGVIVVSAVGEQHLSNLI